MFFSLLLSAAMSADELYLHALARLQSLPQTPYIEYTMDQTNSDLSGENRFSLSELVIERRSDHTSFNAVEGGDSFPLHHVLIGRHYLIPDMLLRENTTVATPAPDAVGALPELDRLDQDTLKVLVTVHAVPKPQYALSIAGDSSHESYVMIDGCGETVHVLLKPKGDTDRYNVRELWIRPTDFAICQVRFNSKDFSVRKIADAAQLDVTARINDDGLAISWKVRSHSYLPAPGFTSIGTGTFSRFLWTDSEPAYLFDEILWTKHANEVKAQTTPHP